MASSILIKITCFVVTYLVFNIPLTNSTELCDKVRHAFIPNCFPYLKNPGPSVPEECCNGLKDINNWIGDDTDKRIEACKCMQFVITITPGPDLPDRAKALPGKCGVDLPYELSPWEECDRVKY